MSGKFDETKGIGEPPQRLISQLYPSTNTLVLVVKEYESFNIHHDIYALLSSDADDIQCLDFSQYELKRQVRVTFFDVRDAYRALLTLQGDTRFQLYLDLKGGTNRSVVFPRGSLSLDVIAHKMQEFGEIEKIWFNMAIPQIERDNVVIDFFDSRAPLTIVRKLEQAIRDAIPSQ